MYTHLIVGLGNPEGKYFGTYHNIGFEVAEAVARTLGAQFKQKNNQLVAEFGKVLILKPLTYMNLSGQAVLAVVRKHKIDPANIIVLFDDLYIDKGNVRVSFGGSGGGHNGIKSITELLGTNQYARIRVGIAPGADDKKEMKDYVLSKIKKDERPLIDEAIKSAAAATIEFANGEAIVNLQGKYNRVQRRKVLTQ
ncbi:MAG: aminoacyl-tRNA hydrolase [Christensenellaceae bacterium]|jgi:PTH1 family peptidyl-tRNA hydrolase|nr:aminoacyl-tRNA hydrolase [Christensenellaceae bacterium]